MKRRIKKFLIQKDLTIKQAMRLMDENKEKVAFITNGNDKLIGSLTDGDIRRWILANGNLDVEVKEIYNKKPKYVRENYDVEKVKAGMLRTKIEWIPVVDDKKQVVDILIWDDIFGGKERAIKKKINVPVVIMAGGSGVRLEPFTNVLPKPLIPIKGRPIIELIMDKFNQHGINQFFISVNYKSRIIKAYFEEVDTKYRIEYITENKPLGTAGCLRSLYKKVKGPVFVTNCDIIIDCNYDEIADFHSETGSDITIVGSMRHFVVPYGICEIDHGGVLKNMKEKPSYDFLINTGMYMLSQKALSFIPKGKTFQMTQLINQVKENGGKVGVFPISEKSWVDVGQWEEYQRTLKQLRNV